MRVDQAVCSFVTIRYSKLYATAWLFRAIRHKLKKALSAMQHYQMFSFHPPLKLC